MISCLRDGTLTGTISSANQPLSIACHGAGVAEAGQPVLVFAADIVEFGDVLGGDAHVVAVENLVEGVEDHQVMDLADPGDLHAVTPAAFQQGHRRLAHVLLAAGHHHLGLAGHDRLGGEGDRLEAGTADLVDAEGRGLLAETGPDHGLPAGILALARLQDIAHDDLIDGDLAQLGIPDPVFALQGDLSLVGQFFRHGLLKIAASDRPQADLLQGFPQDQGPQINHRHILQSAAECSHGCPASADNDHFIHFILAPCKGYGQ